MRHAYSLPPDDEVAEVGPVDPQIGVLRLDRLDGRTLAVVYNFACHPIQGVPGGGNTADITGFASKVIEDNLSEGTVALFLQGCGGDINPVFYKDVDHPRSAEPLGNMLGLSTLQAVRKVECREDGRLTVLNETTRAAARRPHRADRRIGSRAEAAAAIAERDEPEPEDVSAAGRQVQRVGRVSFVLFPPLSARRGAWAATTWRSSTPRTGGTCKQYIQNIHTMEELTRVQTNLALLRKHQAEPGRFRQADDRRRIARRAHRRFRAADVSRRADGADRAEHQEALASSRIRSSPATPTATSIMLRRPSNF